MIIVDSFGKNVYLESELIGYLDDNSIFIRGKRIFDISDEGVISYQDRKLGYVDEGGNIIINNAEVGYIDEQNNFVFNDKFKY